MRNNWLAHLRQRIPGTPSGMTGDSVAQAIAFIGIQQEQLYAYNAVARQQGGRYRLPDAAYYSENGWRIGCMVTLTDHDRLEIDIDHEDQNLTAAIYEALQRDAQRFDVQNRRPHARGFYCDIRSHPPA